jgi:L-lactate dehydrogenase complex protein LldG
MTDARSEILARVRGALVDRPDPAPVVRDYRHTRSLGPLTELAAERIGDYRATVHFAFAERVRTEIAEALRRRGAHRVACPLDLPAQWRVPSVQWLLDDPEAPLSTAELDGCDGVVTGCALVVAETGTIVLDAGTGQGRRVLTLLPDYHLCVLTADQIVGTVPEAVARLGADRPLTLISGPSATSDIEFDRVEGVHGPRTLEVLIVE